MNLSLDLSLFVTIFCIIFVAELPDKTALASVVLATRYKPAQVFVGAAAALMLQSVIAIVAGSILSFLPDYVTHTGSGILFIVFAVLMWRRNEEEEEKTVEETEKKEINFYSGTWLVFIVVFIAEWGDLTQLATATMAARYANPLTVFLGATLALWAVAALAILVGNRLGRFLDPTLTKKIAAVIFVIMGLALILGAILKLFYNINLPLIS